MISFALPKRLVQALYMDYLLVYVPEDKSEAMEINETLQKCGLNGAFYDKQIESVFYEKHCEYAIKFFLVSNNCTNCDEFVIAKSEALVNKEIVIPIWLQSKHELSHSRALYGLMAIQGLNPHSKYFEENLIKLKNEFCK